MIVYRIGSSKYARDLSGEGARLHGGRWNHRLTPCIYTAASRALAILEYSVNVNIDFIPRALEITTLQFPDESILTIEQAQLPGDWFHSPAPPSSKDFITPLLKSNQYLVIKVPSVVVPEEFNFLVNPQHKDIAKVKILGVTDCIYDLRIKTK